MGVAHQTGVPRVIAIVSLEFDRFDKAVKAFIDDKHLSLFFGLLWFCTCLGLLLKFTSTIFENSAFGYVIFSYEMFICCFAFCLRLFFQSAGLYWNAFREWSNSDLNQGRARVVVVLFTLFLAGTVVVVVEFATTDWNPNAWYFVFTIACVWYFIFWVCHIVYHY